MKRAQVVCLLALLATACGPASGPAAQASPSAYASPSELSSIPAPSGSPLGSPATTPKPATGVIANLKCRLPVISPVTGNQPPGGWITFPGGAFVRDQASIRNRSGYHVPSYDRAIQAWVPVEYQNVSPNGASYVLYRDAATAVPNEFYLVDAKTGKQRLTPPTPAPSGGSEWQVLDYAVEGIYLSIPSVGMAPSRRGLWLMDPQTGKVRLLNGQYYWRMVSGGSAWALEPWSGPDNGSWPSPRSGGYKLYRLDLRTGKVSTWYETKKPIRLLSPTPDGGVLIDYGTYSVAKLALVSGPGLFAPIALPRNFSTLWDARMTRPGVWLNLVGGIALYVKGEGVKIVARNPDPTGVYMAVGGCW